MCIPDHMGEEFQLWLEQERALLDYEEPGCDAFPRLPSPAREDRAWDAIERDDVEFYSQKEALR
jgi:hypothetical protein